MVENIGLITRRQEIRSKDLEVRLKIKQIKSLINTLYKGTTEKTEEENGGGERGSGNSNSTSRLDGDGSESGKEDRGQNSIRLIFSAIKNKFYNIAGESAEMNEGQGSAASASASANASSVSGLHFLPRNELVGGNATDHRDPEVLFDDVVLESLSENPFLNFVNASLKSEGPGDGGQYKNGTESIFESDERNSSLKRNLDFLASALYNYNAPELLQSSAGSYINSFGNDSREYWNKTNLTVDWDAHGNGTTDQLSPMSGNYWALILIVFPFLTLFGNVLVIMAVVRERALQTATNYFIVSLALADLLVAVLVMPFAVYVLVNGAWSLPAVVCDFYIAMDVTCSTSSIFNLVAISIDRYIAVTQPIKYAKHKNTQRVWSTIALVWVISAAIGSPIVLGLNNTPERLPDLCLFYNSDFIIYSSLSSFYIPCIIMVFLYYNIFKALRNRARKAKGNKRPNAGDILPGSVIENVLQTRRLAETALGEPLRSSGLEDERPTNTGSGSNEDEGAEPSPGSDEIKALTLCAEDCEIIPNDKSTEFILSTVAEESSMVASSQMIFHDPNGNNDSGYAASNLEDAQLGHNVPHFKIGESPVIGQRATSQPVQGKDQKSSSIGSRFTIYKVNKASKKKREKSSAKKERKATKTLAIVLGVFLICWVPFFTCNILDALCTKLSQSCQPGVAAFILTTWLGYFNSFVNPVIYTIFNPEFRKAFKKIMSFQN